MRRATFETLSAAEVTLFYWLIPFVVAIFVLGVARLVWKYRRGHGPTNLDHLIRRIRSVAAEAVLNRKIGPNEPVVRVAHLGILYGFVALTVATAVLMVNDDFLKPLFGLDLWRDTPYIVYSFLADVFGLALVVGLTVMAVRRLRGQRRYDYRRPTGQEGAFDRRLYVVGDWTFLVSLLFLGITGFVIEAYRIAVTDPGYEIWSVVGWPLSRVLRAAGVVDGGPGVDAVRHALWWGHALVALVVTAAIPYTKAMHLMTSPMAIAVKDEGAGRRLVAQHDGIAADLVGYGRLTDFTRGHLLGLDACTRCGLCHVACPATASGAPLSPRDLILDLREAAEGAWGPRAVLRVPPRFDPRVAVVPGIVRPETVWSCTTCMACVKVCPVGIEHVPILIQLRRQLLERGELDDRLQDTLEKVAATGNSFGAARRTRARWTRDLDVPPLDLRLGAAEYLWFVGDYGSFDPRAQAASRAFSRVLTHAGIGFGLLYDSEQTAACDVRRVGEEALWASDAQHNIAAMSTLSFDKIVTADPHTFHTLRNEYATLPSWRELEADRAIPLSVLHHSQLLDELVQAERVRVARPLGLVATYHDPCFLGRYNEVYESPRAVLRAIGVDVREMPRNKGNSFCCGAGGGVIWMKERDRANQALRPAEQRIIEAIAVPDVTVFVVACPKDASMYSAAVTSLGLADRIVVRELAELVWDAIGGGTTPDPPGGGPGSANVQRINEARS